MPRIIHAADIHLDSPLQGLGRLGDAGLAAELRAATRRAYDNLVQLCIDENADLLVIAGDIYDGDWRSYETGEYFVRGLRRLRDCGIEVALLYGIFLNQDEDFADVLRSWGENDQGHFGFYDRPQIEDEDLQQAAEFVMVHAPEAETDELETIFNQLTVNEPGASWAVEYRRRGNRPLTVGDVIQVNHRRYVIEGRNVFRELEPEASEHVLDVRVFLNEGKNHRLRYDTTTADLRLVAEFQLEDADYEIDPRMRIFLQLNVDGPSEPWAIEYRRQRHRPPSIGDVIEIDGKRYAVAGPYFHELAADDATQ